MREFRINETISIVCESEKTRYGFRHLATLLINGLETHKAKCCYYNRTWESYEFQSVMQRLIETSKLSESDKELCNEFLEKDHTDWSGFRTIAMVAKMGEIICSGDQKASNDWKARMIKAGLGSYGLEMPSDWDKLSEDEKQARLDKVVNHCLDAGKGEQR